MSQIIKRTLLCISILTMVSYSTPARAEMDTRIKALMLMAGYGAIGGALLGTAALAFDADGRAVAKGASLGLYAGIIFGSYVVLSHYLQKQRRMNPEPAEPYQEEEVNGGGGGIFGRSPSWEEYNQLNNDSLSEQSKIGFFNEKARSPGQDVYVNLLNYQF